MRTNELYDLSHSLCGKKLAGCEYPWEALPHIAEWIVEIGKTLSSETFEKRGENIWIAKSAKIAETAHIDGPCIIDEDAEVRHCAFIRGGAMVGKGAVVGNSTELKNCILFDKVQVPHYNYVGDSVLGYCAHLGAGAVTSNVKSDKTPVVVRGMDKPYDTNRKKCGAMLGDYAEVGCNSVLNPGTVIGKEATVYPTSCVRGTVPTAYIYKDAAHIVPKRSDR